MVTLKDIAVEIVSKYIKKLGRADSKAKLVTFPKSSTLPETADIDGCRFNVTENMPCSMKCNRCQRFGHL